MTVFDTDLVRRLHRMAGDQLADEGHSHLDTVGERLRFEAAAVQVVQDYSVGERMRAAGLPPLSPEDERALTEAIVARMYGAGPLQNLLAIDTIEDIHINGWQNVFVVHADGTKEQLDPIIGSDEELIELIQQVATYSGINSRPFDAANPQLDLRLPDGSRLSATMGVCVAPVVSIRRNRFEEVTLADLVEGKTITQEVADFLKAAVRAKANIMIAGATGAGKTTMLRALANEIDSLERIVTVEKALEVGLSSRRTSTGEPRHPDLVEFEERMANSEGAGAVLMSELVRRSLRMSPDRVIVGEVLGPEIITMLNAMTQGNDGSLSTIHARSSREVFERITTYALQSEDRMPKEAALALIKGGLDFVLFLARDRRSRQRRLVSLLEVVGIHDSVISATEVFRYDRGADRAVRDPEMAIARAEELEDAGWVDGDGKGWGEWK